jgi:hypothetical protein
MRITVRPNEGCTSKAKKKAKPQNRARALHSELNRARAESSSCEKKSSREPRACGGRFINVSLEQQVVDEELRISYK